MPFQILHPHLGGGSRHFFESRVYPVTKSIRRTAILHIKILSLFRNNLALYILDISFWAVSAHLTYMLAIHCLVAIGGTSWSTQSCHSYSQINSLRIERVCSLLMLSAIMKSMPKGLAKLHEQDWTRSDIKDLHTR